MASTEDSPEHREISDVIHQMNNAWANGHPDELERFFHEDIVMVQPDFTNRSAGREACIASYAEFCGAAIIHGLKLGDPGIEVFGDTAIATYSYEIDYEMGGERFSDKGRDIFVFTRSNGQWRAVWRTMIIPQPESVN